MAFSHNVNMQTHRKTVLNADGWTVLHTAGTIKNFFGLRAGADADLFIGVGEPSTVDSIYLAGNTLFEVPTGITGQVCIKVTADNSVKYWGA